MVCISLREVFYESEKVQRQSRMLLPSARCQKIVLPASLATFVNVTECNKYAGRSSKVFELLKGNGPPILARI